MLRIKQRFSIKKLSIGVLSVGLAMICYVAPSASAADETNSSDQGAINSATEIVENSSNGTASVTPASEDKPARDDTGEDEEVSTNQSAPQTVEETTISVDEEGNELAKEKGTKNARNGDIEFNGKTYTHFSTEVDEATKTTKHIYTRVQTFSKDTSSNLLAEEDGRQDYKTGDVEFNGKYYAYVDSEVNKGMITHYYKPIGNEVYTFKHYLVNSDGTREHHAESDYTSRDTSEGSRLEIIEHNGKTYFKDAGEIDYSSNTVESNYIERKKVTKHVVKDTTDFSSNGGTTTQSLNIPETEHEPKSGIFEVDGKYYKYSKELPNLRTFVERTEEIHYLEYEEVSNVTKHVTPDGVIEIEENVTEPKQGNVKFKDKEYIFDRTETVGDVTTHYYKLANVSENAKDAPILEKEQLKITRFVTLEGEEVDLQEGALRVKDGGLNS